MRVIFCMPKLTMEKLDASAVFFEECKRILDEYVVNVAYISSEIQVNQLMAGEAEGDDIFVFFTSVKYVLTILKGFIESMYHFW